MSKTLINIIGCLGLLLTAISGLFIGAVWTVNPLSIHLVGTGVILMITGVYVVGIAAYAEQGVDDE